MRDFFADKEIDLAIIKEEDGFVHFYFSMHGKNFTDIRVEKEKAEAVAREILGDKTKKY